MKKVIRREKLMCGDTFANKPISIIFSVDLCKPLQTKKQFQDVNFHSISSFSD